MASLTVRNIPEDAKQRFRQIAAAHGRSMEEHLRQLVIDAKPSSEPTFQGVRNVAQNFQHEPRGEEIVQKLIKAADGAGFDFLDPRKYSEIRFLSAKDAMAELRRLANGVGLDLPPRLNPKLEAPDF
jgi:plasmid stability protein